MSSHVLPDLYRTLGVTRDAGETNIRGAYGRAVLAGQAKKNAQPSRQLLDFALATLTDPEMRARYDERTPASATVTQSAPGEKAYASAAFDNARTGALWFAGGGLLTAVSYAAAGSGGKYSIAWGAVLFGGIQLLRGLAWYLRVPASVRTTVQIAVLGVLIAIGALSSGWVIASEAGLIQDPTTAGWNASLDRADPLVERAVDLFAQVGDRTGAWSARDSADMIEVSKLYEQVADIMSIAPVDPSLHWYRDGITQNFRNASSIANGFAALSAGSGESEFEALNQRWKDRIADLRALSNRFDEQVGTTP